MLIPRKRTTSNNFKGPDTPIDARQRAIAEKEKKLKAQVERYQRLIEEAPKLAEERARAKREAEAERARNEREQFIKRASRTESRATSRAALPDSRYELNAGAPAKMRKLKAERNRGRTTFFVLLIILAVAVFWLYNTVVQS